MKFKTKPLEIEAAQWNGSDKKPVQELCGKKALFDTDVTPLGKGKYICIVQIGVSRQEVPIGCWICKAGDKLHIITDKQFKAIYEPA